MSNKTRKRAGATDAIALLLTDHRKLRALFAAYQKLAKAAAPPSERAELALKLCEAIAIHTELEAKLFYPAARAAIANADLVNQADVEHAIAQRSIKRIERADNSDVHFDARVIILCNYMNEHLDEEESTLFPLLQNTELDLVELGQRMSALQERLFEAGSPVG